MSIDRAGQVTAYQVTEPGRGEPEGGDHSPAELASKYALNRKTVGSIDPALVLEMHKLVGDARRGPFSEPRQVMADAGNNRYVAMVYDARADRYREVLIDQSGDWWIENRSPAAQRLKEWLRQIRREFWERADWLEE